MWVLGGPDGHTPGVRETQPEAERASRRSRGVGTDLGRASRGCGGEAAGTSPTGRGALVAQRVGAGARFVGVMAGRSG